MMTDGIKPRALSKEWEVTKTKISTIYDVQNINTNDHDVVCICAISNEAKTNTNPKTTADNCVNEITKVLKNLNNNKQKAIIIQAPPSTNYKTQKIQDIIHSNLQLLQNNACAIIDLDDLTNNNLYTHTSKFNDVGTSILASRIKHTTKKLLH